MESKQMKKETLSCGFCVSAIEWGRNCKSFSLHPAALFLLPQQKFEK